VLENLSKNLDIKPEAVIGFLLDTCKQLGLVQLELELLGQVGNHQDSMADLFRIYEETQKLQGFILTCTKFGGFFCDC
jgi:hypothetical protein